MVWTIWWVWMAAGLGLAILEVLAPGFILLGFAIGAFVVGLLMAIGGSIGGALTGSLALTLVLFSVFSLVAWLVLRKVVGVRDGQIKVWDRDINDN